MVQLFQTGRNWIYVRNKVNIDADPLFYMALVSLKLR